MPGEFSDRLIIVDDDPHVLRALQFAFEVEGYEVKPYKAGEELLDAQPTGAACIVIDENLPGMSGSQTAAMLRASGLSAPIILITTCPSRELRRKASEARAEIVEKPLVADTLARRVEQAMRRAPVADG